MADELRDLGIRRAAEGQLMQAFRALNAHTHDEEHGPLLGAAQSHINQAVVILRRITNGTWLTPQEEGSEA